VYSPRFIYVFRQLKTSFLLCSTRRGLCLHPVLPVAWASFSPTALCISGSLELVLWYCNNFYSNSILFEVRNVFTSLLGLVIVSYLSPRGLGRFNVLSSMSWIANKPCTNIIYAMSSHEPLIEKSHPIRHPQLS
jgi:hypothetical protein